MDQAKASELLARERARIESELRELAPSAEDRAGDAIGDSGDQAGELFADGRDEAVAESLRARLEAIGHAEERLANGTYGLSTQSGEPIPEARLEADPAAELTVEEQRQRERG